MTEGTTVFTPPAQPHQNTAPAVSERHVGNPDTPSTAFWDQSPGERWLDMRDGPNRARIGDRELSAAEYETLTYPERLAYAERRTEIANGGRRDPANPAAPGVDPAAAGEKFRVGKHEITEAALDAMLERQGAEDLKKATLPPSPDKYELKLPENFTLPGGIKEFSFNAADPGLAAVRNLAHAKGWSQADLSDVLGVYAGHVAQQSADLANAQAAEIAKIGPNAPQRVDAVDRFIRSQMGDADASVILRTMVSDAQLRFYEKLITRFVNQGGGNFSSGRREAEPTGLSDEQWNAMSYSQKLDYSRAASAQAASNGRRR